MMRGLILMIAMLVAAWAAQAMKPTLHLAQVRPPIDLENQIPKAFGDWQLDDSIVPVLPAPDVQAKLDTLYTQLLARTYVDSRGNRVMLSIAYGSDQGSEATAVHRPEFCYGSQGFQVRNVGQALLSLAGQPLKVQRLVGTLAERVEPITYWVTLDDTVALPGIGRKLAQIDYGLRGEIPDGLLFRVSSIQSNQAMAYELQAAFLAELRQAMPEAIRARYFGATQG